jgi:hypothetical protein
MAQAAINKENKSKKRMPEIPIQIRCGMSKDEIDEHKCRTLYSPSLAMAMSPYE